MTKRPKCDKLIWNNDYMFCRGIAVYIKEYITNSQTETENVGRELFSQLSYPAFVAMYGDLGAGKTAFVRGMVSSFDGDAVVTSPTYNIVNQYSFGDKNLYHFDMYRITDSDDLFSVGFYDYLDNGILVCEWCENIPDDIPESYWRVTVTKCEEENARHIKVEFIE